MEIGKRKKWKLLTPSMGFPCGSDGKESTCKAVDPGSIPPLPDMISFAAAAPVL